MQELLLEALDNGVMKLKLPRLSQYGQVEAGFDHIATNSCCSSMKTNSVVLTDEEIKTILLRRSISREYSIKPIVTGIYAVVIGMTIVRFLRY